ncbi:MAG: M28 family peptidase [Planctomycetota bacterium]|jgi:endoglucanase
MPLGNDFRRRLKEILSCPTAPFHEEQVHRAILDAVDASGRLRARSDALGNLEVVYGKGRPRLLFACHTDHPALEANGDGTATIQGGMHAKELRGAGLRPFHGGRVATVGGAVRNGRPGVVRLRGGKGLKKGTPLVLDLPAYRITDRHIRARAVDDLCAVAACLTLLDRLGAARWRGCVGILFTRAEEVGLVGALGWAGLRRYPRTTTLINLEMSSALPHTPQGDGPILRVGDRVTTFTQGAAAELEVAARALARKDRHFRYQRALMDGGGCEATVYVFSGFRTGALCLPLQNYHNHAARGGMGLEYVHCDDAENLVRWMVEYTRSFGRLNAGRKVERRLAALWRKHRGRLERTAKEIP